VSARLAREKQILAAVWNRKALWLLHLIANAVLLAWIYQWLGIPDQTVSDLIFSVLSALAIVTLTLWLHGATLAYFGAAHSPSSGRETLRPAIRTSLGNLPAFAVWAAMLIVVLWLLIQLTDYQPKVSNWIASLVTLRLRRPLAPARVSEVLSWASALVGYVLVPVLLLPCGAGAARLGFRGFGWTHLRTAAETLGRARYWLVIVFLFAMGAMTPYLLVLWAPRVEGVYYETASLIARFVIAYVIAVTAWLLVASTVGLFSDRKVMDEGPS
jgi:hypothetical protein